MTAMTCQELVELVTDYLEGALPDDTARRFEVHVARCPGCETYLDQMRQTASRLGWIPVGSVTEEMEASLLAAFRDFRR